MEKIYKSVKTWTIRSPFLFALAFFVISSCLDIGIIFAGQSGVLAGNAGIIDVSAQSLLALGTLGGLGWLRAAGFNRPAEWRDLHLLWVPALLALFYFASTLVTPAASAGVVIFAVIAALLTGLDEEARFRGVILQSLSPLGSLAAAALSSLFFALAHLNNLLAHAPPLIALAQIVGAFLLGFGFASCRLRTRTLWPLIFFHALYDLPADITLFNASNASTINATLATISPLATALVLIIPGFILACYGLFLLRPRR